MDAVDLHRDPLAVAHFNRFGRWPDASCWQHPCDFTNTPEAEQARTDAHARIVRRVYGTTMLTPELLALAKEPAEFVILDPDILWRAHQRELAGKAEARGAFRALAEIGLAVAGGMLLMFAAYETFGGGDDPWPAGDEHGHLTRDHIRYVAREMVS